LLKKKNSAKHKTGAKPEAEVSEVMQLREAILLVMRVFAGNIMENL